MQVRKVASVILLVPMSMACSFLCSCDKASERDTESSTDKLEDSSVVSSTVTTTTSETDSIITEQTTNEVTISSVTYSQTEDTTSVSDIVDLPISDSDSTEITEISDITDATIPSSVTTTDVVIKVTWSAEWDGITSINMGYWFEDCGEDIYSHVSTAEECLDPYGGAYTITISDYEGSYVLCLSTASAETWNSYCPDSASITITQPDGSVVVYDISTWVDTRASTGIWYWRACRINHGYSELIENY